MRRATVEKDPRPTARTIVPPHVFAHMATLSDAHFPGLAERGRESLVFCDEIRSERLSLRGVTPLTNSAGAAVLSARESRSTNCFNVFRSGAVS